MKVTLLKEHNGMSKGSVIDVPEAQANYLIRVGAVEEVKEKEAKPKPAPKEKAEPKKQPPKK